MARKITKTCSIGSKCKGTCIEKSKACLPELTAAKKSKVSDAVKKLNSRESVIDKLIKDFENKGGSIPAASKLLVGLSELHSSKKVEEKIGKINFASESLKENTRAFLQLTGKTNIDLEKVTSSKAGSHAIGTQKSVNIKEGLSTIAERQQLYHELGHYAEYLPGNKKRANDFIEKHATGPVQSLRKITGNNSWTLSEVARPGNFFSPYVGRIYASGNTEVFSVGLEQFASPAKLSAFYQKAPEHFNLIMDFIKSE
jgi:hypothetical protein